MATQKILVTGAAGFIGSHLLDYLIEQNILYSQIRLVIAPWDTTENIAHHDLSKLEIIKADIRDKNAMEAAVKGMNVVYHLAARIDFDGKTYADYKDVNVTATEHLLRACKGQKIVKFIFFSSIGVFGLPAGIGPIEGWDETHPKTYTNFYGQSKWEGEERVMQAHDEFGLPYAIVRPASVYGPREKGPTLALYRAIKNHQFMMIGNGENKMHYAYVKDLVHGAYQAHISKKTAGDYILAGAKPTPFNKVVAAVATSINEPVPTIRIPKSIAMIAAYGMEAAGNIVGIKPPLFPSRVRTMTTPYYFKIDKARNEIGYNPQVLFQTGAKMTGEWYLKQGWL